MLAPWLPIPLLIVTVTALILVDERTPPGAARNVRWVSVWKPLSTLLVIAVAGLSLARPGAYDPLYSALVLGGLALSLAGDVLLIFASHKTFLAGLVAFLCAHLMYIAAFVHARVAGIEPQTNLAAEIITAAILALIAGGMYLFLKPKLGKMELPVMLYMLVISVMVHRALALVFAFPARLPATGMIAAGALLFYLSDALLAIDRFRFGGKMPHRHLWGSLTYYAGQLLIALSASYMM